MSSTGSPPSSHGPTTPPPLVDRRASHTGVPQPQEPQEPQETQEPLPPFSALTPTVACANQPSDEVNRVPSTVFAAPGAPRLSSVNMNPIRPVFLSLTPPSVTRANPSPEDSTQSVSTGTQTTMITGPNRDNDHCPHCGQFLYSNPGCPFMHHIDNEHAIAFITELHGGRGPEGILVLPIHHSPVMIQDCVSQSIIDTIREYIAMRNRNPNLCMGCPTSLNYAPRANTQSGRIIYDVSFIRCERCWSPATST